MIDTLKFAKSFELAGFAKPQAEALTAAMAEMTSLAREDLVTKVDLRELGDDLRRDITATRTDVRELGTTLRGETVAFRNDSKVDLKVAVAELRAETTTTVSTAKSQILWTLLGSQLFVIASFIVLNNFNKLFN